MISVDRRLFIAVDAETTATDADASTEHHIPHVHVSTGLCGMVLLERCHMFHCQNRRFPPLQLSVSTPLVHFSSFIFIREQFCISLKK